MLIFLLDIFPNFIRNTPGHDRNFKKYPGECKKTYQAKFEIKDKVLLGKYIFMRSSDNRLKNEHKINIVQSSSIKIYKVKFNIFRGLKNN